MSNISTPRNRRHVAPQLWSGPTAKDVLAASGRSSIVIRFYGTGRGLRKQLLVSIGPAFFNNNDRSVNFSGQTTDGKFAVKGRLEAASGYISLATIELRPLAWPLRRVS